MISDVYMIILTAFALFGAYSFAEQLIVICRRHNSPKSVTVMKYEKDLNLYHAINHMHNKLFNNEIILISDNPEDTCPLAPVVAPEELLKFITFDLFTKN